jgi:hypothetical protein
MRNQRRPNVLISKRCAPVGLAEKGRRAEDVMALLRDYHAAIGEIIIKYNGTLERYAVTA